MNYPEAHNEPPRFCCYRLVQKVNNGLTIPKPMQSGYLEHEMVQVYGHHPWIPGDWYVTWEWQLDWMLNLGGVPELQASACSKRLRKKFQNEIELYEAAQRRKDSRSEAVQYSQVIDCHLDERERQRQRDATDLEELIGRELACLAIWRRRDTSQLTQSEIERLDGNSYRAT